MKKIVIPGEKIADGKHRISNTFVEGDATYAAVIGTLDDEGRFIGIESRYVPYEMDTLVGVVIDSRHAGYEVDVNMPSTAFIPTRDIRIDLQLGGAVMAKIRSIEDGEINLTEVRKLPLGGIMRFPPSKVPRLIGKQNSMVNMIKEATGGDIIIGNNGYIWVSDKSDMPKVIKAVKTVEEEAHTSGLTDRIAALLKE